MVKLNIHFGKKVEFPNVGTGVFCRFFGVSIFLNDNDMTSYHIGIQRWWVESKPVCHKTGEIKLPQHRAEADCENCKNYRYCE